MSKNGTGMGAENESSGIGGRGGDAGARRDADGGRDGDREQRDKRREGREEARRRAWDTDPWDSF